MPSHSSQYLQPPPADQSNYSSSPSDYVADDIPPPPPPLLGSYPISQASYINRTGVPDNRPFPPPPPQAGVSAAAPVQHYPRFTDYLQNESHQLKQRGHVYRVSNPSRLRDVTAAGGGAPVRKTVRFSADAKNNETSLLDPAMLDQHHVNTGGARAVPNNYVDSNSIRHIALQRSESLNTNSSMRNNQTYLPQSPNRDSGVCMRGLSSLELDSLVWHCRQRTAWRQQFSFGLLHVVWWDSFLLECFVVWYWIIMYEFYGQSQADKDQICFILSCLQSCD